MRILFVHGWGYGPKTWDAVIECLGNDGDYTLADFGFFGEEELPFGMHYDVVVGHSLGVLWLLSQHKITWNKLVSICGFTKFSASVDFSQGVSPRVIERMIRKLPLSAENVLKSFHELCNPMGQVVFKPTSNLNEERLSWGLKFLRDHDARTLFNPSNTFVLADETDQVVPEDMSRVLFGSENITWVKDKGHLVPITAPKACCDMIERAILSQ